MKSKERNGETVTDLSHVSQLLMFLISMMIGVRTEEQNGGTIIIIEGEVKGLKASSCY